MCILCGLTYEQCLSSASSPFCSHSNVGINSWQPVFLIKCSLWKTTSSLVPYLGSRLPRPWHYSEPMGHLMNLIFKPVIFYEVWVCPSAVTERHVPSSSSLGPLLPAGGSPLTKLKQVPSTPFPALLAFTLHWLWEAPFWCCSCPSGSRLE